MTSFENGPAKGRHLNLRRAVRFLRVTMTPEGKVDALDQLSDQARADETLFAYEAASDRPSGFACGRGHCSVIMGYRYVPEQPSDADMRDNAKWVAWCERAATEAKG